MVSLRSINEFVKILAHFPPRRRWWLAAAMAQRWRPDLGECSQLPTCFGFRSSLASLAFWNRVKCEFSATKASTTKYQTYSLPQSGRRWSESKTSAIESKKTKNLSPTLPINACEVMSRSKVCKLCVSAAVCRQCFGGCWCFFSLQMGWFCKPNNRKSSPQKSSEKIENPLRKMMNLGKPRVFHLMFLVIIFWNWWPPTPIKSKGG